LVQPSGVATSKHSPSCIHPLFGQIAKDSSTSAYNQSWRIFHEREARSNFANDSRHLCPQPATRSFNSGSASRNADVLAGESAAHNVNESAPRLAVEGSHVIPDRELWQDAVALSLQQDAAGIRFNLNSTDAGMSEKHSTEDSPPCSSK
jgi:hypothetical protein